MHPNDAVTLADYRRQVAALYAEVRNGGSDRETWVQWRNERDRLFKYHPQSAVPVAERATFAGLEYFDHDPAMRFEVALEPANAMQIDIGHSGAGNTPFLPIGAIALEALGSKETLTVYWLDAYGGGLFLPFRDATAGDTTYGGGRYLLDTVKGADLGGDGSTSLVIDFNYAYHPSCVHNTEWSCPLAPPQNRVALAIPAGERL